MEEGFAEGWEDVSRGSGVKEREEFVEGLAFWWERIEGRAKFGLAQLGGV